MQCLRCGKEMGEGQVFCAECQAVMEKHPVKPHTVIHLPDPSVRERHHAVRKPPRVEDDTELLHRTILRLRLSVCMLTALLMLFMGLITWQELNRDDGPSIGQNYTSIIDFSQGGR